MFENILSDISQLTPLLLYIVLFVASFIENVFPPSPSDFVVVVGGSLVAAGTIHFIPTLIITTVGSVLGFMTLFFTGLSELDIKKTIIYASVSALLWNSIIVYLGVIFGNNLAVVDKYLSTYRNIGIIITVVIIVFFVIKY